MSDPLAFYEVGCEDPRGLRFGMVAARRLLRRVQRPSLFRLAAILRALCDRIDAADRSDSAIRHELEAQSRRIAEQDARIRSLQDQIQGALALGWDQVATARRLAAIEDRLGANVDFSEDSSVAA